MPIIGGGGAAAASGAFSLIQTQTLGGAAASIAFTAIPGTFSQLRLYLILRGDNASLSVNVNIRLNGDSGANYDLQALDATGATVTGSPAAAATSGFIAAVAAGTASANVFGVAVTDFPFYSQTTTNKAWVSQSGSMKTLGTTTTYAYDAVDGMWRSTAAITRIDVLAAAGNFIAGSAASLYGLT